MIITLVTIFIVWATRIIFFNGENTCCKPREKNFGHYWFVTIDAVIQGGELHSVIIKLWALFLYLTSCISGSGLKFSSLMFGLFFSIFVATLGKIAWGYGTVTGLISEVLENFSAKYEQLLELSQVLIAYRRFPSQVEQFFVKI